MTDRDTGQGGDERDAATASVAIVAGAALFNEGRFRAARDVWIAEGLPSETPDERDGGVLDGDAGSDRDAERLLRALAATAAAARGAADGDGDATERAETAGRALSDTTDPRGVELTPLREWAERIAAESERADPVDAVPGRATAGEEGSATPPRVRVEGEAPTFEALPLLAAGVAAAALARAGEPGDAEAIATAADLAREERGTGRTEFAELLFAYLRTADARPQVAARLGDRVAIAERKRRDVGGLF